MSLQVNMFSLTLMERNTVIDLRNAVMEVALPLTLPNNINITIT